MIALALLAAILIGSAFRLRHDMSAERRTGWRQAFAISAILLLIYAARAGVCGTNGGDCDIRIAVPKDVTVPDYSKGVRL